MATNPTYAAPPDGLIQSYLAAGPAYPPSDHNQICAVYTTTNSTPTQGGIPVTVPLALPPNTVETVNSALSEDTINVADDSDVLAPLPVIPTSKRVVRLQITDITMPVLANSALRIFLNRPDAHKDIPWHDPHHVAYVAYFCCGGMTGVNPCFVFDITRTMKRLKLRKLIKNGWNLQILGVPLMPGTEAPVVIPGTITVTVAQV